jgi:type I restriction enzyme S subunit
MSEIRRDCWSIRLGDAGTWLSGGTPSTNEPRYWGGEIPWISASGLGNFRVADSERRITNLGARSGTQLVSTGTVVFVVRGMSLKKELRVGVAQRQIAFGQDCKAIVPRAGIDGTFLGLAIKARANEILSMVDEAGHGTGRLPTDLIRRLEVWVPPLPEQKKISEIIETLDHHTGTVDRLVDKEIAVKNGLLRSLSAAHFSDDRLEALGNISILITSGSRGWAQYYSDNGALFVRIGNLTRDHINLRHEDHIFVRPPKTSEGRRTALHAGDVLISITADLGIVGVVPPGLGEAYVNQHIALVRTSQHVNPRWVGHMLASESGQRQFQTANDAGAKAGLNLPAIGRIKVPLPERPVQDHAVELLDEQDAVIRHCRREKAKLRLLKQGLMDDLLTGRVRVGGPREGRKGDPGAGIRAG